MFNPPLDKPQPPIIVLYILGVHIILYCIAAFNNSNVGHTSQKHRNVFQLWDIVLFVTTELGEERKVFEVFPTGMGGVEFGEFPEDDAPSFNLLWGVVDPRDRLSTGRAKELHH